MAIHAFPGFLVAALAAATQDSTSRVSVDSSGAEANDASERPAVSRDGRHVVFQSWADDLVAGDTNGNLDIFVHDRVTKSTVRVSVDSSGAEADASSFLPAISADGRVVAFSSVATNLVAGDTNTTYDVFVHDRDPDGNGLFDEGNGVTLRVSVDSSGAEGDDYSIDPSISDDGERVVFSSSAKNLDPSDQNSCLDVFLHDLATGSTQRVSVAASGAEGNRDSFAPSISGDGGFVAFSSYADNLVSWDYNLTSDVFVRDLAAAATERVSVDSWGAECDGDCHYPSMSFDGKVVAFAGDATNLVIDDFNETYDVFLRDRVNGITERVSVASGGVEANGHCFDPALSWDGTRVVFTAWADNLVASDASKAQDVFVHDRASGLTFAASVNCGGVVVDEGSEPSISGDGQVIAFSSWSDNLIAGDANEQQDAYVRDLTIPDPDAAWSNYGAGQPGTAGIPSLTAGADPSLGAAITIDIGNSLGLPTLGFLFLGFGQASIPIPQGGTILVDFAAIVPVALAPGVTSFPAEIPVRVEFCGATAYLQAFELDVNAPGGLSSTPGLELVLGH